MPETLRSRPGNQKTRRRATSPVGISLATVHPGVVSHGWHESVLKTLSESPHRYHLISVASGVLIAGARNHAVGRFLDETDDDYFLSVDSDIEWEPGVVGRLVGHDLPIVSGLYVGDNPGGELFPVFNVVDSETGLGRKATFDDVDAAETNLLAVHGVGMGFCLVKRAVLETLGTRLFWPFEEIAYRGQPTGEDVTFCIRAESAGFKSYVDLGARVGHRKAVVL